MSRKDKALHDSSHTEQVFQHIERIIQRRQELEITHAVIKNLESRGNQDDKIALYAIRAHKIATEIEAFDRILDEEERHRQNIKAKSKQLKKDNKSIIKQCR